MLFWFKVLIVNSLVLGLSTASYNKTRNKTSHLHRVTNKEKTDNGLPARETYIDNWSREALQYNVSHIHSLQEIYAYLRFLATCPYGHVKLQNLTIRRVRARLDAITEEGNYIPYLNISVGSYLQKPAIIIIGGVKGCHWLTVAASMNLAQQLVVYYDKNYEYNSRVTWIVIPVLNPDGYNLTLSDEEMRNWPKNLGKPPKPNEQNCSGVDLCLNFEYQWAGQDFKASSWCDLNYPDKPFTQNESRALRDTVADHLDSAKMFVTLLQNKRALMYPFRYTIIKPIFWKKYEKIISSAAEAAHKIHGRSFKYGHVSQFYNQTSGELDDWVMAHLGVSLGFTYEIAKWRDNNKAPSAQEIQWTNDESCAALKIIAKLGIDFNEIGFLPSILTDDCIMTCTVNIFAFISITVLETLFLLN